MGVVLGFTGFGGRATARDRLTVTSGTATYDTANTPSDSPSSTAIGGAVAFRAPWVDDEVGTPREPSTDAWWFAGRLYPGSNDTTNDAVRLGVGRSGSEVVTVSLEDETLKPVLRIAGTVRATATVRLTVDQWARAHVELTGTLAGDVCRLYLDGDVSSAALTYTLVAADETALAGVGLPNEFLVTTRAADRVDDLVALDPADPAWVGATFFAAVGVAEQVFTGAGGSSGWTGAYTAIDERPASDSDSITAGSVGLASAFTRPALDEPNVFAVKVAARVTRSGSAGGTHLIVRLDDGTDTVDATVPAPTDGDAQALFEFAPSGAAWSPTVLDATEVVFVSET